MESINRSKGKGGGCDYQTEPIWYNVVDVVSLKLRRLRSSRLTACEKLDLAATEVTQVGREVEVSVRSTQYGYPAKQGPVRYLPGGGLGSPVAKRPSSCRPVSAEVATGDMGKGRRATGNPPTPRWPGGARLIKIGVALIVLGKPVHGGI
ncbi:hypothetical protein UVI_02002580 [Ustilaginoidea virens]|uniref:Uncharacterized protein n=1 Tax=Ustilaginoidea virens TaxID=1159556 RepID=A0A1B5KZZ9_USTVR|nr:hypothetical protein UVI_02002580 [Ustilaginoidea virens]